MSDYRFDQELDAHGTPDPYHMSDGAQPMLDLRGHDGASFALPYRLLQTAEYDSNGILLEFTDYRVIIRGRNLRSVYEGIVTHRVAFVREDRFDHVPESETFVDSISVKKRVGPPPHEI